VPGFEESLEHVERNQSENVLVEGNPYITRIGCTEQGGDCTGGQICCDGLDCQNVHVGSEILTDMSCQPQQCKDEGMVCGGSGPSCCDGLECQNVHEGSETLTAMSCQPQCKQEGKICGGSGPSCCDSDGLVCKIHHGVWKCCPYDTASVDLAAEATNATVPGFEESLEHVERNQSENVLVEGNPYITPIGCKEQGGDCSGGQSCCDGLECQNVHEGSEILTDMSCQPQCKDEGMVCGGSGPSCCDSLACQIIHGVWKCSPYGPY